MYRRFSFSVVRYITEPSVRRQSCGDSVKHPFSQLVVLYGASNRSSFISDVAVFHTRNTRNHLLHSASVIHVKKTTSAGGRLYGSTPGMADNRTRGWTPAVPRRLWDLAQQMLLQLSGSPLGGV